MSVIFRCGDLIIFYENYFKKIKKTTTNLSQTGVWHYPAHATSGSCLAKHNKLDSLTLRSERFFPESQLLDIQGESHSEKMIPLQMCKIQIKSLCTNEAPDHILTLYTPSGFITRSGGGGPWVDFDWPWIKTNQRVFCQSFAGFR